MLSIGHEAPFRISALTCRTGSSIDMYTVQSRSTSDALKTQLKWMHPGCKRPDVQLCELIGQCARVR